MIYEPYEFGMPYPTPGWEWIIEPATERLFWRIMDVCGLAEPSFSDLSRDYACVVKEIVWRDHQEALSLYFPNKWTEWAVLV